MYEKHVKFILCLWENVASVAYLEGRLNSKSYGMQSGCRALTLCVNVRIIIERVHNNYDAT